MNIIVHNQNLAQTYFYSAVLLFVIVNEEIITLSCQVLPHLSLVPHSVYEDTQSEMLMLLGHDVGVIEDKESE
jgi:hypothetical protein